MAENITMKQVPNGTVKAVDDRILYDYALSSGVIYGCEISYIGNNMIHINAGYGIIKGGLFEMEDHIEYVDYAENESTPGQIYLRFDAAADDKLIIVKETTPSLHIMEQDADANFDGGVYEIQLCTFTATTTTLENVKQTFQMSSMPIDVLDSLAEITANTTPGKAAGALAVKELNSNFAYDSDGIYGYHRKVDGADTIIPFSNGFPLVRGDIRGYASVGCRTENISKVHVKITSGNAKSTTIRLGVGEFSDPSLYTYWEITNFDDDIDVKAYDWIRVEGMNKDIVAEAFISYVN